METPIMCSKIPNHSTDWKLNPNVECRIILNKLKIKTPEYETMELCRTLKNLSVPKDPATAVFSTTTDKHFKSEFVLDVLLNEILGKCEEKCKVCEEYVQQLRHHINQAHCEHPNPSPYAQTVTVFRCDICSSIYSSPSMLIRHRNTHTNNSDTIATTCTNEPELVRFDSNNISTSFDISCVSRTNESESSGKCGHNPLQPLPVPPMNFELNSLKQESSESQLDISNLSLLGIQQHVNHFSTIENNLKHETDDSECQMDLQDPLLLQDVDIQVPSFVKSECTGISTESEQQTVLTTHEKSSNDKPAGGESLFAPSELIKHRITQCVPKPHKCDICGKCYGKSDHLTQHKLTHSGKKPHKCGVCGNCFTLSHHLAQHKLTHTGEKPFRCDVCGQSFARRSCLASHKLTHTGERPYGCDVCEKTFRRSDHLKQHKRTHTGEKSFHCDVCGQSFYRGYELSKHKLKHAWQTTANTLVNHLKEERESEEEGCQEDPLLNIEVSSLAVRI